MDDVARQLELTHSTSTLRSGFRIDFIGDGLERWKRTRPPPLGLTRGQQVVPTVKQGTR